MNKPVFFYVVVFLLVLAGNPFFSQEDKQRTLIGTPTANEKALNIVADGAGNTYVGGIQDKKGLVVKQNALYQTLWAKTFRFTTNVNDEVVINFLDLVGDTVFGCGVIHQSSQVGAFYFKMNAQTGVPYWSKFAPASNSFFSCMRYANGKFFLIGGIHNGAQKLFGKAIAVSSQTGNQIWETPLKRYLLPGAIDSVGEGNIFLNATQVYNGKFYITGYCSPSVMTGSNLTGPVTMPLLIGITENGTVFMEKWLNLPDIDITRNYVGTKIHLDEDHNLIITSSRRYSYSNVFDNLLIMTKCDTAGNVLFSKNYHVGSHGLGSIEAFNETADSYVIFGTLFSNNTNQGLYVFKTDKNGNLQRSTEIVKPNTFHLGAGGGVYSWIWWAWSNGWWSWSFYGISSGNSSFVNGKHYFVSPEVSQGTILECDINQIILNEDLDEIEEDCSQLVELPTPVHDVPTSVEPLLVENFPNTMSFQNGIILDDLPPFEYCTNTSLNLVQNSGCEESVITANTTGFTGPTFYWSDGTVSTTNTLTVNSTDTLFLRVLDTKCCELFDTIVPFITPSAMTMTLPADTIVCFQTGGAYILLPTVSNPNVTPVQYLWSNNTTFPWLSVTASGTYWVEVSDSCKTIRDSIVVTVQSMPGVTNAGSVTVCEGSFPVNLNPIVSAGATVLWEDGSTAIPRSVSGVGTYTLSVTNSCGTIDTAITVNQTDLPEAVLVSSLDSCVQNGASVVLSPTFTGTTNIVWSDGSTGNQLSVSTSGSYTVYASNSCGVDSATCSVTISHFPELDLPAALDTCFEIGAGFAYTAHGSGGSYQWSSGLQSATEWITQEGTYSCTLTNVCGSVTDSISISKIDLPVIALDSLIDTCIQNGASIVLTPLFAGTSNILWSDGSTGNQLLVSASGTYTVFASNVCGTSSVSCSVTIKHFPELNLPATLDTCFELGVGFAYTAQGSGGSYQWSSGSQTATEWISQEGMYSCTLTNVCGSITDSMRVRRYTAVDLYFPEDSIRECEKQLSVSLLHVETNYNLEIFAPNGNLVGTYLNESGWYKIHAFNPCGEVWDSIYVNLQNEQFFYLPNSFTPNGDSHNERYEFEGENVEVRNIRIFNRWGEEIFSQAGSFTGWDGTYKGENCPDGMYAVSLIYEDCFGMPTEFNGHVNLIR